MYNVQWLSDCVISHSNSVNFGFLVNLCIY